MGSICTNNSLPIPPKIKQQITPVKKPIKLTYNKTHQIMITNQRLTINNINIKQYPLNGQSITNSQCLKLIKMNKNIKLKQSQQLNLVMNLKCQVRRLSQLDINKLVGQNVRSSIDVLSDVHLTDCMQTKKNNNNKNDVQKLFDNNGNILQQRQTLDIPYAFSYLAANPLKVTGPINKNQQRKSTNLPQIKKIHHIKSNQINQNRNTSPMQFSCKPAPLKQKQKQQNITNNNIQYIQQSKFQINMEIN